MNEGSGQRCRDFSGLHRDGTITYSHATAILTWVRGQDGLDQALHFEGLDPTPGPEGGVVQMASGLAVTNFITTTASGFSAWVYCEGGGDNPKGLPAAGQGIVGCAWDSSAGVGLSRTCKTGGAEVDTLWAVARISSGTVSVALATVASLNAGWNHVWCAHDGGFLYGGVNGVQTASVACTTQSFLSGITKIGKGNSKQFYGGIQDARIYNWAIGEDFAHELYAHPYAPFRPSRAIFIPAMASLTGTAFPGITFAEAAANEAQDWTILLTIEGIGDALGIWKFCSKVPDYAIGADDESTYKPWLQRGAWPNSLSEEVDRLGGVPKCGELDFKLVDFDDELVAKFRTDRAPVTIIDAEANIGIADTFFQVEDGDGIEIGDVIFIRNEAMKVTGKLTNLLTVTRGILDTDPQGHEHGSPVYLSTPYMRSRRIKLHLSPTNAEDSAEETLLSTNFLDIIELTPDLGAWRIAGRSQLKFLSRLIAGQVLHLDFEGFRYQQLIGVNPKNATTRSFTDLSLWPDGRSFFKVGDEVIRTTRLASSDGPYTAGSIIIDARAQCGTKEDDHKSAEKMVRVITGDPDYGEFRFSPASEGPSEDRSDVGAWIICNAGSGGVHFVDACLCKLTSSARVDDGLELTNYDPAYGNWSSLPPGFGIGMPHALIDWPVWLDIKARTPDWTVPNLVVGDESIPFAQWIEENFLKPFGAFISFASGKVRLVLPRVALVGESATEWDFATLVRDKNDPTDTGLVQPPRLMASEVASSLTFKYRTSLSDEVTETVTSAEYQQLYSQGGFYQLEEHAIEIPLPSARADNLGFNAFVRNLGLRRLWKLAKPQWIMTVRTGFEQWEVNPGDSVALSHPQLPDMRTGTRGWTSVPLQVLEKTLCLSPDFWGFEWVLSGPGPEANIFGRVCPAGNIITVIPNGGNFVLELTANRYTCPDAADGLPTTDAAAFRVGDRVRIVDRAGTPVVDYFETVTVIGVNAIEITGDFLGDLATGQQIIFGNYDDSLEEEQATEYVFFADRTDYTIGDSDDPPFLYAE